MRSARGERQLPRDLTAAGFDAWVARRRRPGQLARAGRPSLRAFTVCGDAIRRDQPLAIFASPKPDWGDETVSRHRRRAAQRSRCEAAPGPARTTHGDLCARTGRRRDLLMREGSAHARHRRHPVVAAFEQRRAGKRPAPRRSQIASASVALECQCRNGRRPPVPLHRLPRVHCAGDIRAPHVADRRTQASQRHPHGGVVSRRRVADGAGIEHGAADVRCAGVGAARDRDPGRDRLRAGDGVRLGVRIDAAGRERRKRPTARSRSRRAPAAHRSHDPGRTGADHR